MVVVFALMTYGNNCHGFIVINLEQCDITGSAKRNH